MDKLHEQFYGFIVEMAAHAQADDNQAVSLLPCGLGTRLTSPPPSSQCLNQPDLLMVIKSEQHALPLLCAGLFTW